MRRRSRWGSRRRKGASRGVKLLFILIGLIALMIVMDRQLAPIVEGLARQQAHSSALAAMEQAVQQTLSEHPEYQDYQQLMILEKDNNGHVAVMIPNTMRLNEIVSTAMLDVDQRWSELSRQDVRMPLGTLSGSKVLAGLGPEIKLNFSAAHAPSLTLKDEFIAAGINQTRHRIWLDMSGDILISAPFSREKVNVSSTMLLAESVIVGPIPETYLNFSL